VQQTAYTTYAYLVPSPTASRLTRHAREDLAACNHSVRCQFHIKARKSAKGKKRAAPVEGDSPLQGTATTSRARPSLPTKRKREEKSVPEDDDVIDISSDAEDEDEDDDILEADPPPRSRGGREPLGSRTWKAEASPNVVRVDPDSEEEIYDLGFDGDEWMYSHRQQPRQRRRTKSPPTMADLSDF